MDDDLKAVVTGTAEKVVEKMEKLRVADALTEIFNLFKRCNKYIDETMPWALAKDEAKQDRLATVLYNLVESITTGASLLEAFMPETTERILKQLGAEKRDYEELDRFGLYPSGNHVTDKPEILFARLDVKEVLEKAEALQEAQRSAAQAEASGTEEEKKDDEAAIHLEPKEEHYLRRSSGKCSLRSVRSLPARLCPNPGSLLCSQVKIGDQVRQIVSGIKAHYTPEEMVGKKVMVLVNLKPAKLAGVLSEGMLLCAEDPEGNLALLTPEKEMPSGAEIC